MELPSKVIIIIIIGIIVAAVGIIAGSNLISESREGTEYFWDVDLCIPENEICTATLHSDNCCEDLVCRKENSDSSNTICLSPAGSGDYCERDLDCLSENCDDNSCQ